MKHDVPGIAGGLRIIFCCVLFFSLLSLIGCAKESLHPLARQQTAVQIWGAGERILQEVREQTAEPVIIEADWSRYFDGFNGCAVIFDPQERCYQVYNPQLAENRRSPCSTFKIISSLVGLEHGMIEPERSTRFWSGETFWNEDWNRDIDFSDAFHASCVWYFREVIDEIGPDTMEEELGRLSYGNCDISDWAGRQNTNNGNPALTGFWIESSLLISPREQVEVLERIFGDDTDYTEETRAQLKQVMLYREQNGVSIYGKTGMGKEAGILVDAWYAGFAECAGKRVYFCVYLGKTEDPEASSGKAREIAVEIVGDSIFGGAESDF